MTTRKEIVEVIASRLRDISGLYLVETTANQIWDEIQGLLAFSEDHLATCTASGWTISHPVYCRPDIASCKYTDMMSAYTQAEEPPIGQSLVRLIDGLLVFEPIKETS